MFIEQLFSRDQWASSYHEYNKMSGTPLIPWGWDSCVIVKKCKWLKLFRFAKDFINYKLIQVNPWINLLFDLHI